MPFRLSQAGVLMRRGRFNMSGDVMIDPKHVESDLPELVRTDDPRRGAVAWALLAVGVALNCGHHCGRYLVVACRAQSRKRPAARWPPKHRAPARLCRAVVDHAR
jgi:hypothetical protein